MNILLLIVVMLLSIDQYALTHILHRPLVACSLLGLVLGDVHTGVIVGGTIELFSVYDQMNHHIGMNDGSLLTSILATIAVIVGKLDTGVAMSIAVAGWYVGIACNQLLDSFNMVFLPMARKAAETTNVKKIGVYTIVPLVIRAVCYGVLAMVVASRGAEIESLIEMVQTNAGWILIGLSVAGRSMMAIGLAVLLRNLDLKNMQGALWAGIAFAAIATSVFTGVTSLLLSGIAAFAIAAYDYQSIDKKNGTVSADATAPTNNTVKTGGGEKWW